MWSEERERERKAFFLCLFLCCILRSAKAGDVVQKGWPAPDTVDDSEYVVINSYYQDNESSSQTKTLVTICLHTGYCIAEVGRILFSELLAKECARDPGNNLDVVCVSNISMLLYLGYRGHCSTLNNDPLYSLSTDPSYCYYC